MLAKRGRKAKPTGKRIQEGNRGHVAIRPDPFCIDLTIIAANGLPHKDIDPPYKLNARRQKMWDRYIRRLPWFTNSDIYVALGWIELAMKIEDSPEKMTSADLNHLRTYSATLGLDPSSRLGIMKARNDIMESEASDPQSSAIGSLIGKKAA